MLRGLPCKSAGLATSSEMGSTVFSCCFPACGSRIGSATNSQTASLAVSTRMKGCHARVRTTIVHGCSWCDAFWYKAIERIDRADMHRLSSHHKESNNWTIWVLRCGSEVQLILAWSVSFKTTTTKLLRMTNRPSRAQRNIKLRT